MSRKSTGGACAGTAPPAARNRFLHSYRHPHSLADDPRPSPHSPPLAAPAPAVAFTYRPSSTLTRSTSPPVRRSTTWPDRALHARHPLVGDHELGDLRRGQRRVPREHLRFQPRLRRLRRPLRRAESLHQIQTHFQHIPLLLSFGIAGHRLQPRASQRPASPSRYRSSRPPAARLPRSTPR